ncbi:ABC transporter permease [Rothia halotolerans]|uniref:ABC transporter permease n=1 Tax=Rothia halotolerans TaxID=405770 RepID=UPI00101D5B84|nr:ABC transporter permease [Rothia halotolerans]
MRALRAELSKLVSLPASWLAAAVGVVVSAAVTVLSAGSSTPGPDTGFSSLALGVAGAIVIGVVAMSSEYAVEGEESAGGRQITTTLTAVPSRLRVLLAKALAVAMATAALAVVAIAVTFGLTALLLGDRAPVLDADAIVRMGGMALYWVLVALLAFALTVLTRNGVVPMAVLIANFSAVPVTFLLTRVADLANWLPDVAGMRMWSRGLDTSVEIAPVLGGAVMAAWVAVLLVIASVTFTRRDA